MISCRLCCIQITLLELNVGDIWSKLHSCRMKMSQFLAHVLWCLLCMCSELWMLSLLCMRLNEGAYAAHVTSLMLLFCVCPQTDHLFAPSYWLGLFFSCFVGWSVKGEVLPLQLCSGGWSTTTRPRPLSHSLEDLAVSHRNFQIYFKYFRIIFYNSKSCMLSVQLPSVNSL